MFSSPLPPLNKKRSLTTKREVAQLNSIGNEQGSFYASIFSRRIIKSPNHRYIFLSGDQVKIVMLSWFFSFLKG